MKPLKGDFEVKAYAILKAWKGSFGQFYDLGDVRPKLDRWDSFEARYAQANERRGLVIDPGLVQLARGDEFPTTRLTASEALDFAYCRVLIRCVRGGLIMSPGGFWYVNHETYPFFPTVFVNAYRKAGGVLRDELVQTALEAEDLPRLAKTPIPDMEPETAIAFAILRGWKRSLGRAILSNSKLDPTHFGAFPKAFLSALEDTNYTLDRDIAELALYPYTE